MRHRHHDAIVRQHQAHDPHQSLRDRTTTPSSRSLREQIPQAHHANVASREDGDRRRDGRRQLRSHRKAVQRPPATRTPGKPRQPRSAGPPGEARPNRTLSIAASNAAQTLTVQTATKPINRRKWLTSRDYSASPRNVTRLLQHYRPKLPAGVKPYS